MGSVRPLRCPSEHKTAWARRWKTSWKAELQAEGERVPCVVLNMSVHGAGLSIDGPPDEGTVVSLVLSASNRFPARVVWRRFGAMGVCFLDRQLGVLDLVAKAATASGAR